MSDVAPVEGAPAYEWKTYHNENGTETRIAEVPEDGHIITYGGEVRKVRKGDKIAQTTNANYFTVVQDEDDWTEGEFTGSEPVVEDETADEFAEFDPSTHTVGDVKNYIDEQRAEGNTTEVERVVAAEQAGKNRAALANY